MNTKTQDRTGQTASLPFRGTLEDFISRELAERPNTPAFYDGFQFITPSMKYGVVEYFGQYELRYAQELVKAGFERNIVNNCSQYEAECWLMHVRFNPAAEQARQDLNIRLVADRVAREESARIESERQAAAYAAQVAHRAELDRLLASVKWTKQQIALTDHDGKTYAEVSAKVSGLVAVHKNESGKQWNVTHVPSGALMAQFDTQDEAKIAAVRFSRFNLNRDPKALGKDMELGNLARAMRRTSDAYAMVETA